MTLDEAKKKIRNYMKQSKDDYNRFEDDICRGEADAYSHALSILEQVDTAPVGNPDKLTLTELAHELKKIFKFKWLTVDEGNEIQLWVCFSEDDPPEFYEDGCWYSDSPMTDELCSILPSVGLFAIGLDLSEYEDENGEIDYSRCIVEVE